VALTYRATFDDCGGHRRRLGTVAIMRHTTQSKEDCLALTGAVCPGGLRWPAARKTRPSRVKPSGTELAERIVALTIAEPPGETTH
jgi:hypothetical protein